MPSKLVIDTHITSGTWNSGSATVARRIRCWGGGAGGNTNTNGGGGGAYAESTEVSISASTNYTITVGAGGNSVDGGDSSFETTVVAKGGTSATGLGGTAAASTGATKNSGGDGAFGTGNQPGGASAGADSAATTTTPGEPDGAYAVTATNGRCPGGGGGSAAGGDGLGARGEVQVWSEQPATAGFARVVAVSHGRTIADATSFNVTLPEGSGGRLILFVAADGNPTVTGTEWNETGQSSNGTTDTIAVLDALSSAVSDPSSIAVSSTQQVAWQCFRVYDSGTPEVTFGSGTSTNINPPSITPSGGSANYLIFAAGVLDGLPTGNNSPPTSYGNFLQQVAGTTTGVSLFTTQREITGTTEDPGTYTTPVSNAWVAATVALPFQQLPFPYNMQAAFQHLLVR